MSFSRRDFLKKAGLGIAGIAYSFDSFASAQGSMMADSNLAKSMSKYARKRKAVRNMSEFCAPKMDVVRIGIIGLGQRGTSWSRELCKIGDMEIKAICDIRPERANAIKETLNKKGHNPDIHTGDSESWKTLCERSDLDLILITTPFYLHAMMAIYAMEQGKHVASEVPLAGTIDECWKVVETSEKTGRHCMMLENYVYMEFQLLMLNMAYQGFFGDIVHGEGAYNTSKMGNNFNKDMYWNMWWLKQYGSRKGNLYPTHGLGPIAHMMGINRGDSFDHLYSMESNDFMINKHAMKLAETDEFFRPFVGKDYRGNMNTTLIRTKKGRTIMLQHDATSPSPHNLIHGLYGTKGAALFDPAPPRISTGNHQWANATEFEKIKNKYTPKITHKMRDVAQLSGHGGSDVQIMWQYIDALRNGLPIDQNVYDGASQSIVLPLSEWSVRNNASIIIPDFTGGTWETNSHRLDINLERAGDTKILG